MSDSHDGLHYTDISYLILEAQDAFDMASWGMTPERDPMPAPRERADHVEMHEVVEHQPSGEVSDYVEDAHTPIYVPQDVQALGVQAVQHPVQYPAYDTVKVPLADQNILVGKKMPLSSAYRWLAEWCLYLLKKGHIRLRSAHGKAERIFDGGKS